MVYDDAMGAKLRIHKSYTSAYEYVLTKKNYKYGNLTNRINIFLYDSNKLKKLTNVTIIFVMILCDLLDWF